MCALIRGRHVCTSLREKTHRRPGLDVSVVAECSGPVEDSLGGLRPVQAGLGEVSNGDFAFVVSGENVERQDTIAIINWLRRARSKGARIGGLFTGAHILARAGLLNEVQATIHWSKRDAFAENFPDVKLSDLTFIADHSTYTTAGGTASIDLFLQIVSELEGEKASSIVASYLNYTQIRNLQSCARQTAADRVRFRHPKLSAAISEMEENIEEPLSKRELAEHVKVSSRQLERLFMRFLQTSPSRYYTEIRLQRAKQLLLQTNMTMTEIGVACGFNTSANFSKRFRQKYGASPHRIRNGELLDLASKNLM